MDAPLAVEAEGAGDEAAPAQPLLVAVVGDGAVEDTQPGSAGRDDDALHSVVEAVAGILFVPLVHHTDAGLGHAHARSEISGAKVEGFEAARGAGYRVYVGQPFGALYLGFELYLAPIEIHRQLQLGEQGGGDVEVLGAVHLRDHYSVQRVTGLFYHLDQVPVEVRRVQGVGPVESQATLPVELLQSRDNVSAGSSLAVRGDCVFEIEEHGVGIRGERLFGHLPPGCGDGEEGTDGFHVTSRVASLPALRAERRPGPPQGGPSGGGRGPSSSGKIVSGACSLGWR